MENNKWSSLQNKNKKIFPDCFKSENAQITDKLEI